MPSIAIVGYGYWGPKLVRNFLLNGSFSPVLIVEENAERLTRGLRENPGAQGVASYAKMLSRPDVAAVVLATPVATHYPLAKAALESGKHVLVEKPLATTTAHAEELVALAAARQPISCGVSQSRRK